jgi:hypothetical protein
MGMAFAGTVERYPNVFRHTAKSRVGSFAPSAIAFAWFFTRLGKGEIPETLEIWHEGAAGAAAGSLPYPRA